MRAGDRGCAPLVAGRWPLAEAAERHLPGWAGKLTPHVLRHYCASQLYRSGISLFAIQELLGHAWTGTTARLSTFTAPTWMASLCDEFGGAQSSR